MEKIKEKENRLKKKQQDLKKKQMENTVNIFSSWPLKGFSPIFAYCGPATVSVFWLFVFFSLQEQVQELTPEDEIAEKLRLKKLQEDSDLELANDAFGEFGTPFKIQISHNKNRKYYDVLCYVSWLNTFAFRF